MNRYLETRIATLSAPSQSADLARHMLSRQHLGKVVVVCDKPVIDLSVTRKYWLKLSRALQKERASTLNAEKILQLTYDITHMQHMEFAAKPYREEPGADVFFVAADELDHLPANCFSLYIQADMTPAQLTPIISQLPDYGLVVDYTHSTSQLALNVLSPKADIERLLPERWRHVEEFFDEVGLDIHRLATNMYHGNQLNEAIDVILNTSSRFIRVATDFLEVLRLAQPHSVTNTEHQMHEALSILNRRISALTPGILSQQFAQNLGDDELALHDVATENMALALAI
ncbi:MAG TPA: hypothetical protein VJM46_04745 [Candidatus Saccharimonadales bacterium]|nr:hypothetical protein [Candidatus Saccharimonadales bacterium]